MERKQFAAVEAIARQALAEGASETMLRLVGRLRLTLIAESKEAGDYTAVLGQADKIKRLIGPYLPQAPLQRDQIARPTPETAARAELHPMQFLPRRKDWLEEFSWAEKEIVEIYGALTCGLMTGGRSLDGLAVDRSQRRFMQPLERLSERAASIYQGHYKPWAAEMETMPAHRLGERRAESAEAPAAFARRSVLEVAIDVVIDGVPIRDIEALMGLRHGEAARLVMVALRRYCEIAGWLKAGDTTPVRKRA